MTLQLVLPLEDFVELTAESIRLARSIHAKRTLTTYASDWRSFNSWCAAVGLEPFPAITKTVSLYLTDMLRRQQKTATAQHHACAIAHYHRQAGFASPCTEDVYAIITGARRLRGEQPTQKKPVSLAQLREMIQSIDRPAPSAARDRALLLFGFATALRRSSIAAVQTNDLAFVDQGILVTIRREKQDQLGVGRIIAVPFGQDPETCPVRALKIWLFYRGDLPGPIFCSMSNFQIRPARRMHDNTVSMIIKRAARAIGLDPAQYGGHSLRAGFVTEALENGVGEILTARHTGHHSLGTLKRYMRSEDPFRANACAAMGL